MLARGGRLKILPEHNQIDDFFNADASGKMLHTSPAAGSRFVSLIKLGLPIMAGILGLTLLLWPTLKRDLKEFAIDLVIPNGDIEKMSIENTNLYVTDAKGRVNNFTARNIRETISGSQIYNLDHPEVTMPLGNKDEWINLKSRDGVFNQKENLLHLPSKIELFYSAGMNIETREFYYDFNTSTGYSTQPVVGEGFLGHLNAEKLEISTAEHILTFKGNTVIIINEDTLKKEPK